MASHGSGSRRRARAYGLAVIAFLAFLVLLALLEEVGISSDLLGYLLAFFALAIFVTLGFRARTIQTAEFYVSGRSLSPVLNGMATAANWLGAAGFLGVAGAAYASSGQVLPIVLGGTGGFLALSVLIAPYLRKSGAYTIPDFLAVRFAPVVRLPAVLVVICCSLPLLLVQIQFAQFIASRLLAMNSQLAAALPVVVVLACSLLGGMRAVTWTQAVQYLVLAFAFVLPLGIIFGVRYGFLPADIGASWPSAGFEPLASHAAAENRPGTAEGLALAFCLALGTAAMPHLGMRFLTVRSVRETRYSVAWTLLFVAVMLLAGPVFAGFLKLAIAVDMVGLPVQNLPQWLFDFGRNGLAMVCGVAATTPEAAAAACQAAGSVEGLLRPGDLMVLPEAVVFAPSASAGLPYVVSALVAIGALAATLAAASGLTLAMANALSHDVYHRLLDRNAPDGRRLLAARIALIGIALSAGSLAGSELPGVLESLLWCSALAAAALLPVLVASIWWPRCTTAGALAGMVAGTATVLGLLAGSTGFQPIWPPPGDLSAAAWAGVIGSLAGSFATAVASLFTPAPSRAASETVAAMRLPRGETLLRERPA